MEHDADLFISPPRNGPSLAAHMAHFASLHIKIMTSLFFTVHYTPEFQAYLVKQIDCYESAVESQVKASIKARMDVIPSKYKAVDDNLWGIGGCKGAKMAEAKYDLGSCSFRAYAETTFCTRPFYLMGSELEETCSTSGTFVNDCLEDHRDTVYKAVTALWQKAARDAYPYWRTIKMRVGREVTPGRSAYYPSSLPQCIV